eukprot:gene8218-9065_t
MIANNVVVDAIPALDKDFEEPSMRARVLALIDEEMKTMPTSKNYLDALPSLKKEEELDEVVARVDRMAQEVRRRLSSSSSCSSPQSPDSALDNDVQAWRNALSRAQVLLAQQEAQVSKVDSLLGEGVASACLAANASLDNLQRFYLSKLQEVMRQAHEVQKTRQLLAQRAYGQLSKVAGRRSEALLRRLHCEAFRQNLVARLAARGIDADEAMRVREASSQVEALDARVNSTIRQYEEVNERQQEEEEEGHKEGVVHKEVSSEEVQEKHAEEGQAETRRKRTRRI